MVSLMIYIYFLKRLFSPPQIPVEILLHMSAGLLVARDAGTLFPKDKEGVCVALCDVLLLPV